MTRLDPAVVCQQIANLRLQFPDLLDDEETRQLSIESETDAFTYLSILVRKIGESGALADGTAEYVKALMDRKAKIEARIEAFRALAFKILTVADLRKAELPEATLSIRNGTQRVVITEETELPESCIKIIRTPDKTAIKEKLTGGETVPGAFLSNAEPSLTIRIK